LCFCGYTWICLAIRSRIFYGLIAAKALLVLPVLVFEFVDTPHRRDFEELRYPLVNNPIWYFGEVLLIDLQHIVFLL
jgi:hypothetical protein